MSNKHRKQSHIAVGHVSFEPVLKNYYQDFSSSIVPEKIIHNYGSLLDNQGIPLVDYDLLFRDLPSYIDRDLQYGIHYTPVTVAQYALAHWGKFLVTKDKESRRRFLSQADWLCDNLSMTPAGFGVWKHSFAFPIYNLRPPWVSAMAQGQGISVLLRAYQLTNNNGYFVIAQDAYGAFQYDVSEDGVAVTDDDGNLWLEEFPSSPASHVLNGFIYALWGIFDFYRVTQDKSAYGIWFNCIKTLKLNLYRYDGYYWSRYNLLNPDNTSLDYHLTHIMQLAVMWQLTEEGFFNEQLIKWQQYVDGNGRLRRLVNRYFCGVLRRLRLLKQPLIHGISLKPSAS